VPLGRWRVFTAIDEGAVAVVETTTRAKIPYQVIPAQRAAR
jgi:hypothetical protein